MATGEYEYADVYKKGFDAGYDAGWVAEKEVAERASRRTSRGHGVKDGVATADGIGLDTEEEELVRSDYERGIFAGFNVGWDSAAGRTSRKTRHGSGYSENVRRD